MKDLLCFTTYLDFVRRYGVQRFREFLELAQDPTLTDVQRGERFSVTGSCFTRWRGKFTDEHIVLKESLIEFLESQYHIEINAAKDTESLVSQNRNVLKFIQCGRTHETNRRTDSKTEE